MQSLLLPFLAAHHAPGAVIHRHNVKASINFLKGDASISTVVLSHGRHVEGTGRKRTLFSPEFCLFSFASPHQGESPCYTSAEIWQFKLTFKVALQHCGDLDTLVEDEIEGLLLVGSTIIQVHLCQSQYQRGWRLSGNGGSSTI